MVTFNADQEKARDMFDEFMHSDTINEMGLVGPPGRGKSWLVNQLLIEQRTKKDIMNHLLDENQQVNVALTATSNESANLIGETCNMPATTIHSLLGLRVMNNYSTGDTFLQKTKDYRYQSGMLVIIDEAGWVDLEMLSMIRNTLHDCKILYVYDHKQLTSVNKKNGSVSVCAVHKEVPYTAYLSLNERNANPIGIIGDRFRDSVDEDYFPKLGEFPGYVECINDEQFDALIDEHFVEKKTDARILCWTNNMVKEYNEIVRERIYDYEEFCEGETVVTNKPILSSSKEVLYPTDAKIVVKKVIAQGNLYGVDGYYIQDKNGVELFVPYDMDEVNALIKQAKKAEDWFTYFRYMENFNDLRPMYASTVHKIQGKTNSVTFVDLGDIGRNQNREEVKRLLGVAFSRPRDKLYLYGELPAKYRGD